MRKDEARVALREALSKVENMPPSMAFQHYLDGYMNAFDLFPDYERGRTSSSSLSTLLDDFWLVLDDLSSVVAARRATVDVKSLNDTVTLHDLETRKKQTARAILRELVAERR